MRTCIACQISFEFLGQGGKKYCSSSCRQSHYRKIKYKEYYKNYKCDKAKANEANRKWRNKNIDKEKMRVLKWQSEHLEYYCFHSSMRRALKRKATPPWLTDEHKLEIKKIYEIAKEKTKTTGIKYDVDHIVPLKGKDVCGLHVPWNLQLLTEFENGSKNNKLEIK